MSNKKTGGWEDLSGNIIFEDPVPTITDVDDSAELDLVDQEELEEESEENLDDDQADDIEDDRQEEEKDVEDGGDEEDDDTNVYNIYAEALKENGELPEDFEITEDTTHTEIYEAYKNNLEEVIYEEVATQTKQQVIAELQQKYNSNTLLYAEALASGMTMEDLSPMAQFEKLANSGDDISDEEKLAVIEKMFLAQNTPKKRIKTLLRITEEEENIEEDFKEAKQYFSSLYKTKQTEAQQKIQERDRINEEIRKRQEQVVKGVLSNGEILGHKLLPAEVKSLKSDLYDKTEIYEDGKGNKIPITKVSKFLMDLQSPEVKLLAYLKTVYDRKDIQNIKEEIENEAHDKILSKLNGKKVSKKSTKKKNTQKKLSKNSLTTSTYGSWE